MKKQPDKKRVIIYTNRTFGTSDKILNMPFEELKDFFGGRLAVSLFNGKFENEVRDALYCAVQWGEYSYHKKLMEKDSKA